MEFRSGRLGHVGPMFNGVTFGSPEEVFGESVDAILDQLSTPKERKNRVLVIDSDVERSGGLQKIRVAHPEIYISSGVMERRNSSACAGLGINNARQGVFGTFVAFQEMFIGEVTMAKLNHCNFICHIRHPGVNDMSDNNCHFARTTSCGLRRG